MPKKGLEQEAMAISRSSGSSRSADVPAVSSLARSVRMRPSGPVIVMCSALCSTATDGGTLTRVWSSALLAAAASTRRMGAVLWPAVF